MNSYKVGDVVKLNSGGPLMTVYSTSGKGMELGIYCKWFATVKNVQEVKEGVFKPEMLSKVDMDEPRRVIDSND